MTSPYNAKPCDQERTLLYGVEDGVATLTLNRPERRNSLTWDMVANLDARMAEAKVDPDVKVVCLTGAGDKAFCAGADLAGMAEGASPAELHEGRGGLARLFETMWNLGKPVVASVRGYCLAGGFGLAAACDIVVAAEDTVFGAPEVNVGLWPYMVTVPLLRSLPPKVVLELMMTGRRMDCEEAARWGMVLPVASESLGEETAKLCARLASLPPVAMRLGKTSFYRAMDSPGEAALSMLHPLLSVTAGTEDAAEGIAAFTEKRAPLYKGR